MDNPQHNLGINAANEIVQSYDFIAVQPENEKMFQVACTHLDIDMITLDMSGRLAFPLRPGYLKLAMDRGVVFELQYAPMIRDPSARRHTIANALSLLRTLKGGKHVVLSSGATAPWQIRAPSDVMNLAGLLGVGQDLRKSTVTHTPHAAFMHAGTRKLTYRGTAMATPTPERLAAQTTDMLDDFIKL